MVARSATIQFLGLTAITDQTNQKKIFESVAKQHFQKFSWFGFEREAVYVLFNVSSISPFAACFARRKWRKMVRIA